MVVRVGVGVGVGVGDVCRSFSPFSSFPLRYWGYVLICPRFVVLIPLFFFFDSPVLARWPRGKMDAVFSSETR